MGETSVADDRNLPSDFPVSPSLFISLYTLISPCVYEVDDLRDPLAGFRPVVRRQRITRKQLPSTAAYRTVESCLYLISHLDDIRGRS